jgi:hypothetical protein
MGLVEDTGLEVLRIWYSYCYDALNCENFLGNKRMTALHILYKIGWEPSSVWNVKYIYYRNSLCLRNKNW